MIEPLQVSKKGNNSSHTSITGSTNSREDPSTGDGDEEGKWGVIVVKCDEDGNNEHGNTSTSFPFEEGTCNVRLNSKYMT